MLRQLMSSSAKVVWNAACLGLPRGEHIVRYTMYKKLQSVLSGRTLGDRVLSISHSTRLCELAGVDRGNLVEANYPAQQIDKLRFPSDSFSAVVSDQVLEHIECTPSEAVDEVRRVLRPGGLAIHTTCFLTPYHGSQDYSDLGNGDFWRFTPSGLARLHKEYARVITAEGWGNAFMPLVGGLGLTRMPVPETAWHPFNVLARLNRPSYAFVVWVVAEK
jgi:SAM-dependent methyltransferase